MNFFEPVGNLRAWTGTPAFYVVMAIMLACP
jgi:hypothetical protein